MSTASNSAGIQKLLEAEHKAQEIVQEARAYRTQRVKASKVDAQKEVDEYKKKKEEEFKSSIQSDERSEEDAEAQASSEAQGQIETLKKESEGNKSKVIKFLVEKATTTEIPK